MAAADIRRRNTAPMVFRIALICSSLNPDLFINRLVGLDGSYLKLEEAAGLGTLVLTAF